MVKIHAEMVITELWQTEKGNQPMKILSSEVENALKVSKARKVPGKDNTYTEMVKLN